MSRDSELIARVFRFRMAEYGSSARITIFEAGSRHTRFNHDKGGFVLIDALVEKEVIPEVFNELICMEGRL